MYDSGPDQAELDAIGLTREDVEDNSDFEVWPESWTPFQVFSEVSTQWRMGPGGPTGLDYGAVRWVMELLKVRKQREVLCAVQVLESSALRTMTKK
jgi:hypothetical protein